MYGCIVTSVCGRVLARRSDLRNTSVLYTNLPHASRETAGPESLLKYACFLWHLHKKYVDCGGLTRFGVYGTRSSSLEILPIIRHVGLLL